MFKVKEKKPKREMRRKKGKAAAAETTVENVENIAENVENEPVKREPFLKRLLFGEPKPDLGRVDTSYASTSAQSAMHLI